MNDNAEQDPRLYAIPDTHGHAKGEHKPYVEERPLPLTARMLFLWFYHACRRGFPRFLMVADHMNYLTFEDPAAVNLVRRALKLAQAGDLYGAAETANVDVAHAAVVSEGLRRGMRYSIGAEVDNDPRSRPDAQNIVDAMRPDGIVRSVHFIPITHPVHGENWAWPFDNPEFREFHDTVSTEQLWDTYVAALIDAIERLPGHIVGHFFVPAVLGKWPEDAKLGEYEDRVLAAAAARGMAIEFNTRFLYREADDASKARYLEANKRLLRKAKERGVQIAIGSDAHSPKDQAGAFETVLAVLDELEINEIVFPMGGQLRRVALRVVREPEPEPEPVREATPEPPRAEAVATPVRKARPPAKASRTPETSAERPAPRGERTAPSTQLPPPESPAADAPKRPSRAAKNPSPAAPEPARPEPQNRPVPKAAAPAKPAPTKPAAPPKPAAPAKPATAKSGASKPAAKGAPAKPPAKPAAKPAATAKPHVTAAKPAKSAPKPAAKRVAKPARVPAKPAAKPSGRPAANVKKAAAKQAAARPAKAGAKKTARPAAAKKTAAKRAAPSKKLAKKAAPARAAVKRPVAKKAAAKSAGRVKKTAKKKPATKRR